MAENMFSKHPLLILFGIIIVIVAVAIGVSRVDSKTEVLRDVRPIPQIKASELSLNDVQSAIRELTNVVIDLRQKYDTLNNQVQSLQLTAGIRGEQLGFTNSNLNSLSQIVNSS